MNVRIGGGREGLVAEEIESGRHGPASGLVREGSRLVEEREVELRALGTLLHASIEGGGGAGEDALDAALAARADSLAKDGYFAIARTHSRS